MSCAFVVRQVAGAIGAWLLSLGLAFQAGAESLQYSSTTADVAAWNLAGFNPIPEERVPAIAQAIARLDPEVLALVEVNPDWVAGALVAELVDTGTCYRRRILNQTATQNIAVLHKCEVEASNPRLIAGSDDGNSHLRKALAVDVRAGEFDFVLIAVHLKAGRGAANRDIRDRQAAAIAVFIQTAAAGPEKDILVVGDYNMIPGEDDTNFDELDGPDFLQFISSDDLAGQFSHITSSGPGNLLDGYGISRSHTAEYIPGTLRIFPMHQAVGMGLLDFRAQLADHLPLLATFRITEDDD
jgi:endonuclease/exonuclease/phosphatase family metal-dependent hydrolase